LQICCILVQYLCTVQYKLSTLNNALLNIATTPEFVFNNFPDLPVKDFFFNKAGEKGNTGKTVKAENIL